MRVHLEDPFTEAPVQGKTMETVQAFEADPQATPVEPRFAATVMLVRNSVPGQTKYRIEDGQFPPDFPVGQELEVYMMRRVKTMDFVPDAVVFPGGRVDERDSNPDLPWCGPTPAQWAELLNKPEDVARRVVVAAAREVFEECGVLLAGPDEHSVVHDLTDPSWAADRAASEAHEIAFADILIRRGLMLRTDLLGLISNWCTPEFSPKRFDTFFFSALMPEGQEADGKTSEAQIAGWCTPAYAVREMDAKRWQVLMPTLFNLTSIAQASDASSFVGTRRTLKRIMSRPLRKDDGSIVLHAEF